MTSRTIHLVCSVGDPLDPKVWSRTPVSLVRALERQGVTVVPHDISMSPLARRVLARLNQLIGYGRFEPQNCGIGHAYLQRRAQKVCDTVGAGDFLHIGSPHLPVPRVRPGQRHYLFTDGGMAIFWNNPVYRAHVSQRYCDATIAAETDMLRTIDALFITADYVAESFERDRGVPADKIVRVKSGLGRDMQPIPDKDYTNGYMLFVAKQNFVSKGGRLLIDAFELLRQRKPDARLVIIGNRADPTQAEDLPRMENTPGITFYDFDTPDYQQLVARAALYAGPALNEIWGLIYIESLALGTPILGLARNAFPQFAGGGAYGFIAPEPTAESVAATMEDALSDPGRLARMGAAGSEHVRGEYSWDRVAQRILERLDQPSQR